MARFVLALLSLFAVAATAKPVHFSLVNLVSPLKNGVHKITLYSLPDGKIQVTMDPNHCGSPGPCTKIGVSTFTVDPEVLVDARGVDGDLVLKLSDHLNLRVDAGYNLEEMVHITAEISNGKAVEKLPLTASLQVAVP